MKEYDLFIPLCYNDGTPIEARKFQKLQNRLLEQFEGLTFFPQPNEGFWRLANLTYRDEIVIYRVLASKPRTARRFSLAIEGRIEGRFAAGRNPYC